MLCMRDPAGSLKFGDHLKRVHRSRLVPERRPAVHCERMNKKKRSIHEHSGSAARKVLGSSSELLGADFGRSPDSNECHSSRLSCLLTGCDPIVLSQLVCLANKSPVIGLRL